MVCLVGCRCNSKSEVSNPDVKRETSLEVNIPEKGNAALSSKEQTCELQKIASQNTSVLTTTAKDDAFIETLKHCYSNWSPRSEWPLTERFIEYSSGLEYDIMTQAQDVFKDENYSFSKVEDNAFRVKWQRPNSEGKMDIQLKLIVVDEDGSWKIDNVVEELSNGGKSTEPVFDYSKPASYYNVFG